MADTVGMLRNAEKEFVILYPIINRIEASGGKCDAGSNTQSVADIHYAEEILGGKIRLEGWGDPVAFSRGPLAGR